MASPSFAFRVSGIEPRDPAFRLAGDAAKQAFWQAATDWVEEAFQAQLAAGKDRFGAGLAEIAESTRKKGRWRSHTGHGDPNAPPLTPAYTESRTSALFDVRAHWREGYVLGFWRADAVSGRHWGQVLGWHRSGAGHLPVRDVIGLSPAATAALQGRADAWWADWQAGHQAADQAGRTTLPIPPPSNRPIPQRPRPAPIAATGRVDLHNFTFGIGGTEDQTRRAIGAGAFTGFRQLGPRPPSGGKAAPTPAPRPTPAGRPPGRVAAAPGRPDLSTKARPKPTRPIAGRPAVAPTAPPTPLPAAASVKVQVAAHRAAKGPADVRAKALLEQKATAFAAKVHEAAAATGPEARFFDKVFIHRAWLQFRATHDTTISLDEFTRRLLDANRRGKVQLSRADMVEAMNPADVRRSTINVLINGLVAATFNFIRIPR